MDTTAKYMLDRVKNIIDKEDNINVAFLNDDIQLDELGKYISALANLATQENFLYAYAIWGYDLNTREIKNSNFDKYKKLNIPYLSSNAIFSFQEIYYENKRLVVLEVMRAIDTTIQFNGCEYILCKNKPKEIEDFEKIKKALLCEKTFEEKIAFENVSLENVIKILDCETLFQLLKKEYPESNMDILNTLLKLGFIKEKNTGKYKITNLGALLLAKRLKYFSTVKSKAIRVVEYNSVNSIQEEHQQIGGKGYISGFSGLIDYIDKQLAMHIDFTRDSTGCLRENCLSLVKKLIIDAIVNQNLEAGIGPVVSIYPNMIEITYCTTNDKQKQENKFLISSMQKVGLLEDESIETSPIDSDRLKLTRIDTDNKRIYKIIVIP